MNLKIRTETFQKFNVNQIVIVKRTGSLEVSENILLIVVGASHRNEPFKACRHVLERIKKDANNLGKRNLHVRTAVD